MSLWTKPFLKPCFSLVEVLACNDASNMSTSTASLRQTTVTISHCPSLLMSWINLKLHLHLSNAASTCKSWCPCGLCLPCNERPPHYPLFRPETPRRLWQICEMWREKRLEWFGIGESWRMSLAHAAMMNTRQQLTQAMTQNILQKTCWLSGLSYL